MATGNIEILLLRSQWIFRYYYYGYREYLNIITTATVDIISYLHIYLGLWDCSTPKQYCTVVLNNIHVDNDFFPGLKTNSDF